MKKLIFIIQSMGLGGAERVVSLLMNYFCDAYDISLITFEKREKEYVIDNRIHRAIMQIPDGNKKFFVGRKLLEKEIYLLKADIVVAFDFFPNLLLSSISKKKKGYVSILAERNAPKESELSKVSRILRKIYFGRADKFVFQTEDAKNYYSRKIQKKSVIIANPIKNDLPYREWEGDHTVVAVGRLTKQKNYKLLLSAFADFVKEENEYRLLIYGDGKEKEELKKICKDLEIQDFVCFKGSVEGVHKYIRNGEIYVMSSDYEGMPNALMEAMAMGYPVISTDCPSGGSRALIDDEKNGLLVSCNDKDALSDALKRLSLDELFRERLGKNAIRVRDDYSQEKIMRLWKMLFEGCIDD